MPKPKAVAILQSSYIPWKGYFDIIAAVDEFLIFDEVQFTRRDWRNRNKIIIDGAPHWMTIPVSSKGRYHAPIAEIEVANSTWSEVHWRSIKHAYGKAAFFPIYGTLLQRLYEKACNLRLLTQINELFLREIASILEIDTDFQRSEQVPRCAGDPTSRLVEICIGRNAQAYLSGPSAQNYIEPAQFVAAGIALHYADYAGYPTYAQTTATFDHGVSIVDTLMRCGPMTRQHLKSIQRPGGLLMESSSAGA